MEPVFFGESTRLLYGVYHPPTTPVYRNASVLLCYPVGHEYMRIHRAYRQLADQLAAQGFHVFRFDYSCTGDSYGDAEEMLLDRWIDDGCLAAEEVSALAGTSQLIVIGARLGALVAAYVAEKLNASKLVVWDPFAAAEDGLKEIDAHITNKADQANFKCPEGGLHYNGFYYSRQFIEGVLPYQFANIIAPQRSTELLAVFAERSEKECSIIATLESVYPNITVKVVPCLADWNELDAMGGLFLPQQTLKTISDWVEVAG